MNPAAGRAPVVAIRVAGFRRLAGQCNAVSVVVVGLTDAAKRRVLRELIIDAAAIKEIEHSEAAAHHGLAFTGEVVRETEAGAEVVVVIVDQRIADCCMQPGSRPSAGRSWPVVRRLRWDW